jgi:hypothetical protein
MCFTSPVAVQRDRAAQEALQPEEPAAGPPAVPVSIVQAVIAQAARPAAVAPEVAQAQAAAAHLPAGAAVHSAAEAADAVRFAAAGVAGWRARRWPIRRSPPAM